MTEDEVSLLIFQTMEGIIEDLEEIERENWRDFLRGFLDEASPIFDHVGCEHSATHEDPQCNPLPTCTVGRMEKGDEAIGGATLQLKGMAHDCWFEDSVSYFHANVKTYDDLTKGLVKKFDGSQCESSCIITSNTLHALEGNMKQTPLHISKGEEN